MSAPRVTFGTTHLYVTAPSSKSMTNDFSGTTPSRVGVNRWTVSATGSVTTPCSTCSKMSLLHWSSVNSTLPLYPATNIRTGYCDCQALTSFVSVPSVRVTPSSLVYPKSMNAALRVSRTAVVGGKAGEGVYANFQPAIANVVEKFSVQIDRTPLAVNLEAQGVSASILSFPSAVLADEAEDAVQRAIAESMKGSSDA